MLRSNRLRAVLLATTLVVGAGGVALAQQAATPHDPAQLPAIKGTVAEYSLTPRGDVDGLILKDGTEIHLPPHLGTQLVFIAKPGDAVTIHGLHAREVAMVQAMQVTNDATSQSVTDTGPTGGPENGPKEGRKDGPKGEARAGRGPGPEMRGAPMDAQGAVKQQLHGPRGELNGVLLADGTIVRMPPPEVLRLQAQFAVGQAVFVRGNGLSSPLGRVVDAREVGPDAQHLTALQRPPRHGGPDGQRRAEQTPPPVPGATGAHPLPPQGGPDAPPPVPGAAAAPDGAPDNGVTPAAPAK